MGASRREHHRREQAMRDASAEANRQRAMMEQQQQAFAQQLSLQRESMLAQTQTLQEALAPKVNKVLSSTAGGVSTARSARKTARKTAQGVSALRIPLNIGESSASGLNIG